MIDFMLYFLIAVVLIWLWRRQNSLRQQLTALIKSLQEQSIVLPLPDASKRSTPPELAARSQPASTVSPITTPPPKKSKLNFEQQFGARLPVWVGAIAIVLAGFFLVKYSIDAGLLTPTVRVAVGAVFGLVLLLIGAWLGKKTTLANGTRITQALLGAGIADLYLCLFAASSVYPILTIWVGLVGMAVVTLLAVLLSLRYGQPIALLGLVGGLLTPLLANTGSPNTGALFTYLYVLVAGMLIVARRQGWSLLGIPTILGAFVWVGIWLWWGFIAVDAVWVSVFLLAVVATFVMSSNKKFSVFSYSKNIVTIGAAAYLLATLGYKVGFDRTHWALFGLLTIGTIVLNYFDKKSYRFAPWILMLINALMFLIWRTDSASTFAITLLIFALLYCGSGIFLLWRASEPLYWGGLAAATSVIYYLIAYFCVPNFFSSYVWGAIALLLSLSSALIIKNIFKHAERNHELLQRLLSVFALMTTTFVSIALCVMLQQELLPVAFALQMLVIAGVNTKVDIRALVPMVGIVGGVFVLLLAPQLLVLMDVLFASLLGNTLANTDIATVAIANSPLFQLGVPTVAFALTTELLRKRGYASVNQFLQITTVVLLCLFGYCVVRYIYNFSQNWIQMQAGMIERGIVTNVILIIGVVCLWAGRQRALPMMVFSGVIVVLLALLRIVYFDLYMYNPLWSHEFVGAYPVLNTLLLTFALPLLWIFFVSRELRAQHWMGLLSYLGAVALLLIFMLISFTIRQFYQGGYLDGKVTTNLEIYTYSAVWLLFGIALLIMGILRHDKMLRIASLVLMIIATGKIFLYDTSQLAGLYRVFSFLGLGLSLIALSWFYTRFVFKESGK